MWILAAIIEKIEVIENDNKAQNSNITAESDNKAQNVSVKEDIHSFIESLDKLFYPYIGNIVNKDKSDLTSNLPRNVSDAVDVFLDIIEQKKEMCYGK